MAMARPNPMAAPVTIAPLFSNLDTGRATLNDLNQAMANPIFPGKTRKRNHALEHLLIGHRLLVSDLAFWGCSSTLVSDTESG